MGEPINKIAHIVQLINSGGLIVYMFIKKS
jgi:hypothetical protein